MWGSRLAPRLSLWLRGSSGLLGAWHVEETVIAVLHVLEHLEEECFTVAGTLFPLQRGLFPGLCFTELLLEQDEHVLVDVKRVQS